MLCALCDDSSCVTVGMVGTVVPGGEKMSSEVGLEGGTSVLGTLPMINSGCSKRSLVGVKVGDLVGARLPMSMGIFRCISSASCLSFSACWLIKLAICFRDAFLK